MRQGNTFQGPGCREGKKHEGRWKRAKLLEFSSSQFPYNIFFPHTPSLFVLFCKLKQHKRVHEWQMLLYQQWLGSGEGTGRGRTDSSVDPWPPETPLKLPGAWETTVPKNRSRGHSGCLPAVSWKLSFFHFHLYFIVLLLAHSCLPLWCQFLP